MDGGRGNLKPFIIDIPLGGTDGVLAAAMMVFEKHAGAT
jgi:hypothetical protein